MGSNGVGKTSLLKAIVGLHPITVGRLRSVSRISAKSSATR